MISTPSKADTSFSTITPVRFLDSPRPKLCDDQLLTAKARLDVITKSLTDNFTKWQTAQKRGQSLCNSIEAIKTRCLENRAPGVTLFPEELKPPCDKLAIILTVFEDILKNTVESLRQLKGLVKLTANSAEPLYRTWLVDDFVQFTESVVARYRSECVVKKYVTEEIAHCEERSELIRMSSLWEYPIHVDDGVKVLFMFLAEEVRVK